MYIEGRQYFFIYCLQDKTTNVYRRKKIIFDLFELLTKYVFKRFLLILKFKWFDVGMFKQNKTKHLNMPFSLSRVSTTNVYLYIKKGN